VALQLGSLLALVALEVRVGRVVQHALDALVLQAQHLPATGHQHAQQHAHRGHADDQEQRNRGCERKVLHPQGRPAR
jgi:hypothetical protein